jgi:hypothetical protein
MDSRIFKRMALTRADSPTRLSALLIVLTVAGAFSGCGDSVQREYVYTRQDPALGRRSSTVFVVRISIDRAARSIVWVEDVRDDNGDLGRTIKTFTGCTFLDENNWECEPMTAGQWFKDITGIHVDEHTSLTVGEVVEHIAMREGQLHQKYWTEERTYRLRRRILGITF